MFSIIFLDFDGVIVESNAIKEGAFRGLFDAWSAKNEEIYAWLDSNKVIDRITKFRHIAQNILNLPEHEKQAKIWLDLYRDRTRQAVANCSFVNGAPEFLEKYSARCPLFLLSATLHEELEWVLETRKLRKYFREFHGSPIKKDERMLAILQKHGKKPEQSVFIGDSKSDEKFSFSAGVPFIGRIGEHDFKAASFPVYPDLSGVDRYLETRV